MKIEFHNLYIHYILITKNRFPFIKEESRNRIEKYITGIVSNNKSRLYAIYANPEHVHLLVSRDPEVSDEELLTRIAVGTQKFILENKLCSRDFSWQDSASAFSVSKSGVDGVCKYILNQAEHHRKLTFQEEYGEFIAFYQKTLDWRKNR